MSRSTPQRENRLFLPGITLSPRLERFKRHRGGRRPARTCWWWWCRRT
ncbi:MAG: hypothetical protein MZV70_35380 [Desulfobacterales bacterium]|nr:hypothetical protein [Desulfobacterales bacterium]